MDIKQKDLQKKVHEQFDRLLEKGHACIIECQTYPTHLDWCQQKCCPRNPKPNFLLKDLPPSLKIKLINGQIVEIERFRHSNCRKLLHDKGSWQNNIMRFMCDQCEQMTNPLNPIYTHPDHFGLDICSECVFLTLNKQNGFTKDVYLLKEFEHDSDE